MLRVITALLCISAAVLFCSGAHADSTSALVDSGNRSWAAGDYEEALKKYNEATVDDPESPYIYFNKGTALYKKGDYKEAVYEFEKAALKSKDPDMESKARYNLGNCSFREAERQMDSDLKKSLEYCEKSIEHFHDALKLDPGLNEAAENIEIVRLVMKDILDKINKQEREAEEKEKAARENAEKLEDLIKRQEKALEKNRKIFKNKPVSEQYKDELDKLADEQKNIGKDTRELAEKIRQQASGLNKGEEIPALKHLNNAVKEQTAAEGNLRNLEADNAAKNQEDAVQELREALKPPEQNQGSRKQEGQQKEQDQKGQQGQQGQQEKNENQQQSKDKEPSKPDQQDQREQAAIQNAGEDPQDIIDEEKENKEHHRLLSSGGYREVEKDW